MPSRTGVALCLSGGGFRSALFHLGALRRLKELRVLHDVTLVSSVSGGSILSGFFADVLARSGTMRTREDYVAWLEETDWETTVAAPFRSITSRDFRTAPVLKHVLWNWALPGFRVRDLERRYHRRVSQSSLGAIPLLCDEPRVRGELGIRPRALRGLSGGLSHVGGRLARRAGDRGVVLLSSDLRADAGACRSLELRGW